jgi:sulfhydrogenase subunit delta
MTNSVISLKSEKYNMAKKKKPKLAVWKFASCDGCQLSLLDCEDELLAVTEQVDIAYFPEATRAVIKGPYELSLIEGSITTPHDAERIHQVRRQSKFLVTIGACATAGGIQALRNFKEVKSYVTAVYPTPDLIETLNKSTPIADHVFVDFQLRGCPISKHQLIELVSAFLNGRKPNIPQYSVCIECKRNGTTCVMVSEGIPCLGPVTHAGCGAICPAFRRGCYGCFGPKETPNTHALASRWREMGIKHDDIVRAFRSYNSYAEAFQRESIAHEQAHKT